LIQYPPANTFFDNLTDRPDGLDLWFEIQPKFTDYTIFEVRVRAGSTTEMDYVFSNPVLATKLSFPNSTTGSENGRPLKEFLLPIPSVNHWLHLTRNVKQDWLAPLDLPGGMTAPGFQLNDTFNRFEVNAYYFRDSASSQIYGETIWVDDVSVYVDSPNPGPPGPPRNYYASFSFQDAMGNSVNNIVRWKLFNSTGYEVVGYTQDSPTLLLEPYTIEVYYPTFTGQNPEPYRILSQRVILNITQLLPLPLYPQYTYPWGYVAFNNTLSQPVKITYETPSALQFNAQGNRGPYTILVNVTPKPVAVQRNNEDPTSTTWYYDQTLSMLRIPTALLGNFSIFITPPLTIPNVNFQDITGNLITTNISWKVLDSTGTELKVVPGKLVPNGTYTFQAYYYGYKLYQNSLTSTPTSLRLQMLSLGTQPKGYVGFNSTVSSITLRENSSTRLQFTAAGQGSHLIVVNVPTKPVSIERDGTAISSWTYNATTGTVAIQTSQLGTFTIAYSATSEFPLLYIGAAAATAAIVAAAIVAWRGIYSRSSINAPTDASSANRKYEPKNKKSISPIIKDSLASHSHFFQRSLRPFQRQTGSRSRPSHGEFHFESPVHACRWKCQLYRLSLWRGIPLQVQLDFRRWVSHWKR
jgi:hypothetical protein